MGELLAVVLKALYLLSISHRCLDITSQWGVDWQTFSEEIAKQSRSTRRKKRLRKRNLLKKPFFCSSNQHPHSTKRESQMWQSLCKAKGSYLLPKGCQYRQRRLKSDVCPTDSRLTYSILVAIDYNVMTLKWIFCGQFNCALAKNIWISFPEENLVIVKT